MNLAGHGGSLIFEIDCIIINNNIIKVFCFYHGNTADMLRFFLWFYITYINTIYIYYLLTMNRNSCLQVFQRYL